MIRWAVLVLLAGAIFPPFIPIAGPLSADDILPVIAVCLGLGALIGRQARLHRDVLLVGFLALIVIAAISSAANATSVSNLGRLLGRSAGRMSFYVALILVARALFDTAPWPRRVLIWVSGAATLEAVFSVWAYFTQYIGPYGIGVVEFAWWSVLEGEVRVQGTFGGAKGPYDAASVSANFLAAYMVLTVPLTAGLALSAKDVRWRAIGIAATVLQAATLYLTFTRAAFLALVVTMFAFGVLAGRRRLAAAVAVGAIAAALSVPQIRHKFLAEKHDRFALYWASGAITWDHPLFGVGDGNYDGLLHLHQRYHDTPMGIATATSHNSILLAAANYGMFGGVAQAFLYLLLLIVLLRAVRRTRGHPDALIAVGIAAGVIGFLTQDQINNLAFIPKVATQMWLLVAIAPLLGPPRTQPAPAPIEASAGPEPIWIGAAR